MSFVDHLIEQKVLTAREGGRMRDLAEASEDVLIEYLKEKKGMSGRKIMELRGSYLNIPFRHVEIKEISSEVLKYIPEDAALHYRFIPIGLKDGVLEVGVIDPDNIEARDALQFIASRLGVPFKMFLITEEDFKELIEGYKNLTGEVQKALGQLKTDVEKKDVITPVAGGIVKGGEEAKFVEDTPITKIVAVILRHSTEGNASDVHIEHTGEKVRVRFRVDGVLYTSIFLPIGVYNPVIARIKVLAKLRLDEKRKPQDGSFSAKIEDRTIDFRVSTFPAYYGEKIVLRILDPEKGVRKLDATGFTKRDILTIKETLKNPFGLVLLTGPTGSGKTTSLYAMLNELDRESYNVVSLEDPVEYNVAGMSQSQVHPEIGYTFANGLRSILRQDPDIIMVGEIRDKETAQLAIHAALTGHLVFSTLHTNNAAGVIPRLVDMGVDPYLIAPTLILAVAQRLVKVLCPSSKKPVPIEGAVWQMMEKELGDSPQSFKDEIAKYTEVYDAVPSSECPAGTKGRMGVYELLVVDKNVERVILENPTEGAILEAARKGGMLVMKEDALLKAMQGLISYREISQFE